MLINREAYLDHETAKAELKGLMPEQCRAWSIPWSRCWGSDWLFATLSNPEFALGGHNEVLIERIGMGEDLHPFAAAGVDLVGGTREGGETCVDFALVQP